MLDWDHELRPAELTQGRLELQRAPAAALRPGAVSLQLGERGPIVVGLLRPRGQRLCVEAGALGAWLRERFAPRDRLSLRLVGADHLVVARRGPLPA